MHERKNLPLVHPISYNTYKQNLRPSIPGIGHNYSHTRLISQCLQVIIHTHLYLEATGMLRNGEKRFIVDVAVLYQFSF